MLFLVGPLPLHAADNINYVGSSTVGVFMKDAAKVYTDATFNINTEPESGGGETATAAGRTDIGGVARNVKNEILNQGVQQVLIGKDAIGVRINANNQISSLSADQLKGIFTGKITNWKEVGGSDMAINVYIVNPQSATRKVFKNVILGDADYSGKNIQTIWPDPAILDKVAADQNGIGQLSFALSSGHPAVQQVKRVNIWDQEASVNNSSYPITRPLYLITKGEPTGGVKKFVDWAVSAEGQAIVKKYFVGI